MVSSTTGSSISPKLELARKLGMQALAENYASKQHHHLAGTKEAYRQQIEDAQRNHLSNELFMAAIEAYKLEQKDAIVEQLKKELQPIVLADLYHNLRAEALQQLKAEHLDQVVGELKAENRETVIGMLKNDLRMAVKNRLERSLRAEVRQELEPVIAHNLREELRPVIAEELRREMTRLPSPSERAPSSHHGPPLSATSASPRGRKRHRDGSSAPLPSANENSLFFPDARAEGEETSAGPPQGIKRRCSASVVGEGLIEDRGDGIRRRFVGWLQGGDKPASWDDVALEEWSGVEEENGKVEEEAEGWDEDEGEDGDGEEDEEEEEDDEENEEEEEEEEGEANWGGASDEYGEEDAVEVKNKEHENLTLGGSSNEVIDLISSDEE